MRVKKLTDELELTPGVEKINSLFTIPDIRGEDNSIIIEDIITEIPDNIEDMELIKHRIINNKNVYGSIVAEDFSSTAVILVLEEGLEDDQILREHNKKIVQETLKQDLFYYRRTVLADYFSKLIDKGIIKKGKPLVYANEFIGTLIFFRSFDPLMTTDEELNNLKDYIDEHIDFFWNAVKKE